MLHLSIKYGRAILKEGNWTSYEFGSRSIIAGYFEAMEKEIAKIVSSDKIIDEDKGLFKQEGEVIQRCIANENKIEALRDLFRYRKGLCGVIKDMEADERDDTKIQNSYEV